MSIKKMNYKEEYEKMTKVAKENNIDLDKYLISIQVYQALKEFKNDPEGISYSDKENNNMIYIISEFCTENAEHSANQMCHCVVEEMENMAENDEKLILTEDILFGMDEEY